jgi:hypothetical protein
MQRPAENGEGPADLLPERTRAADNLERIPGQERDDADDPAFERAGLRYQVVRPIRRRPQRLNSVFNDTARPPGRAGSEVLEAT